MSKQKIVNTHDYDAERIAVDAARIAREAAGAQVGDVDSAVAQAGAAQILTGNEPNGGASTASQVAALNNKLAHNARSTGREG